MPASRVKRRIYNRHHRNLREMWKRAVAAGTVRCARGRDCFYADGMQGGLILPGQPWDLGHADYDRSRHTGPEHSKCNRAAPNFVRTSRQW